MDEDLVKEQEENQEASREARREQVKKMANAVKKANAQPDDEPQEYTADEQEILRLNVKLKDLKDLYDNLGKENAGLTKDRNELQAKVLELKTLIEENLKKEEEDRNDLQEYIINDAVQESIISELRNQIENLNSIIGKLINA